MLAQKRDTSRYLGGDCLTLSGWFTPSHPLSVFQLLVFLIDLIYPLNCFCLFEGTLFCFCLG